MESITVIVPYRHGAQPDTSKFPPGTVFQDDEGRGKKYALKTTIAAATTEFVWLTDDDVTDAASVIANTDLSLIPDTDMLILPLRMTAGGGSILERLQQIEYAAIQTLTLLSAMNDSPVLCSGANLIVRRERWLESQDDLHMDLPSGDDMFLLESFKRRGLRIASGHMCMTIPPIAGLRQLMRQRMRWAGKAPHYKDKDIRSAGAVVVLLNLFSIIFPPLWLIKLLIEASIMSYGRQHYAFLMPKRSALLVILLSLLYPWYMLISLIGGLLRKGW